jgi:glycine cleavage system transcriptional repressor
MPRIALVTIICTDRVGLVSAIADHLFGAGINLRDTTFAALGQGAEFTSVCELPDALPPGRLQAELAQIPVLAGAQIRVAPYVFDPAPGPQGKVTHRIEVTGGDQLGLIARLADIFTEYGANIVRLDGQKQSDVEGGHYITRLAISIPPDCAPHCLAAVTNTAGSLRLTSRVEQVAG